jgi:NAD(P)-dependent dehydrogenase (short-subunit alcohol dehydrogenase family)
MRATFVASGGGAVEPDRVALVTGGASGIGRASAHALAAEGVAVAVADLDPGRAATVADELAAQGVRSLALAVDATDEEQVAAVVAQVVDGLGGLDLAVNCVGRGGLGHTVTSATLEHWNQVLSMSLTSTWLAMKYEIPAMVARGGGAIVNMASSAGVSAQTTASPAYAAAKAGVVHLTRYAARQYAADGVRVNAVAPGLTLTPTVEAWFTPEAIAAEVADAQFIERASSPQEVAATVAFLCSPGAAMITGHTVPVSGGQR